MLNIISEFMPYGIDALIIGACIGLFAGAFSYCLSPGQIFGRVGDLLVKLPMRIAKPLGLCEKCLAGQMTLWLFIAAFALHPCAVLALMFFPAFGSALFFAALASRLLY